MTRIKSQLYNSEADQKTKDKHSIMELSIHMEIDYP